MERITLFQTHDGHQFSTQESAERHTAKVYGELLSSLALGVARCDKYRDAHDWLESHRQDLALLATLADDMALDDPQSNEE